MTGRVVLVQDQRNARPVSCCCILVYHPGHARAQHGGAATRRCAAGPYAPFIATHFLEGLTHSQSSDFRLRIYDGTTETPEALLYAGRTAPERTPGIHRCAAR